MFLLHKGELTRRGTSPFCIWVWSSGSCRVLVYGTSVMPVSLILSGIWFRCSYPICHSPLCLDTWIDWLSIFRPSIFSWAWEKSWRLIIMNFVLLLFIFSPAVIPFTFPIYSVREFYLSFCGVCDYHRFVFVPEIIYDFAIDFNKYRLSSLREPWQMFPRRMRWRASETIYMYIPASRVSWCRSHLLGDFPSSSHSQIDASICFV